MSYYSYGRGNGGFGYGSGYRSGYGYGAGYGAGYGYGRGYGGGCGCLPVVPQRFYGFGGCGCGCEPQPFHRPANRLIRSFHTDNPRSGLDRAWRDYHSEVWKVET